MPITQRTPLAGGSSSSAGAGGCGLQQGIVQPG
jgi:hypothetical protein